MKIINYSFLIFLSTFFIKCNKRPFAHMEVHGRVVVLKTNQPLQATLNLWVGTQQAGAKGTTKIGVYHTNNDGTFDIKSHTQWGGNSYQIEIRPELYDSTITFGGGILEFPVSKNQNLDLGTIRM